ncbi:hypothetical protein ACHAXR_000500, partial [Thalassiosira sp. AJA248-18]
EEEPPAKKIKSGTMEQAPASEWPEAWIMPDGECKDQKATNKQEPNVPVTVEELKDLGICYWQLDASAYDYPKISVPWDPKDAVDPKLAQIRDDRGYNYADIITVQADTLPEYEKKVKAFFEEHIHDAEEIRYILGGSGYFDVRNKKDEWVRIHIKAGDLMTLPEGIYHRFTVDEADSIHAMRLFIGVPVWTPFNRPCDEHDSRKKYVKGFLEEEKKTAE